jgi:hypothetical protein
MSVAVSSQRRICIRAPVNQRTSGPAIVAMSGLLDVNSEPELS